MTRTLPYLVLVAAAALAGCSNEDHNIVAGDDSDDAAAANADVELPPSIVASKTYRCADNLVVNVDWMSDNVSANLRTNGSPTHVTTAEAGKAMTAPEGYSLEGNATAPSARIGIPGHPVQTCKA